MKIDRKTIGTVLISILSAVGTISVVTKCGNTGEMRIEVQREPSGDTVVGG